MLPFVIHATRGRARQVQFNRRFFGKPLLNMGFSRRFQQMEVKNQQERCLLHAWSRRALGTLFMK